MTRGIPRAGHSAAMSRAASQALLSITAWVRHSATAVRRGRLEREVKAHRHARVDVDRQGQRRTADRQARVTGSTTVTSTFVWSICTMSSGASPRRVPASPEKPARTFPCPRAGATVPPGLAERAIDRSRRMEGAAKPSRRQSAAISRQSAVSVGRAASRRNPRKCRSTIARTAGVSGCMPCGGPGRRGSKRAGPTASRETASASETASPG